uniref:methionine adenosyltransferase n=1 Tax=Alistipes putredinis TaxID=28117 RepID=UPI003FD86198
MGFLFTSESVSEGHPDKVSDQISDAILDEFLRHDPNSKVACETLCTTGLVVVAGEVRSSAYVDIQHVTRRVINRIGYTKSEYQFDGNSCGVLSAIHEQSPDINQGVVREAEEEQGAGDQGIMFGYACNETREYMPATLILSHVILKELAVIRREGQVMTYLRPDAKSQVTIEYDEQTHRPLRVHTIVVSTQHDDFIPTSKGVTEKMAEKRMQEKIREDVRTILIPRVKARLERAKDKLARLIGDDYILHVNPTGKFVIGGPHGDTGLTGRKIIVDSYGGRGAHGGGAFSGKDSSKVDRSAAYAARHIAKNLVAAGVADQILVELSYAIGIAEPLSIYVDTYNSPRPE